MMQKRQLKNSGPCEQVWPWHRWRSGLVATHARPEHFTIPKACYPCLSCSKHHAECMDIVGLDLLSCMTRTATGHGTYGHARDQSITRYVPAAAVCAPWLVKPKLT